MSIELNSFTSLIEENKLRFYKTAKAILKNDDDVYDALQDALMSIYQNFKQLKDLKFFSTWATRIVINKCYDLLRKSKNNVVPFDENIENDLKNSESDVYEIDQYGIRLAIESLNEDLKLITILYYYDDYSVNEISEIVDIPVGTVKSRLSRAREILKMKLGKEDV